MFTLTKYRSAIRSYINTTLSDATLNQIINDGYKDVCVKALCYETQLKKNNITDKLVSLVGDKVVKVLFVEYYGKPIGMQRVVPNVVGVAPISGSAPQFWFQWGDYLYVEPFPDVETYDLYAYAACLPPTILSSDSDYPVFSAEYHEDLLNFSIAFAFLKLKKWGEASYFYNKYIRSVQGKRKARLSTRADREIPDIVRFENA
jgi:hypothetical protein